jgi:hypothetical protein
MSVDFYECDCCEESRYEEYVGHCDKCGHSLCTNCLVNDDINSNYTYDYQVKYDGSKEQKEKYGIEDDEEEKGWVTIGKPIDDTGIDPKYCPFCNGKKVNDDDLLKYLLNKYGIDKEQLKAEYIKTL